MGARDKVARFLYRHDGNPNLPANRSWSALSDYWKNKYRELAEELLGMLEE